MLNNTTTASAKLYGKTHEAEVGDNLSKLLELRICDNNAYQNVESDRALLISSPFGHEYKNLSLAGEKLAEKIVATLAAAGSSKCSGEIQDKNAKEYLIASRNLAHVFPNDGSRVA